MKAAAVGVTAWHYWGFLLQQEFASLEHWVKGGVSVFLPLVSAPRGCSGAFSWRSPDVWRVLVGTLSSMECICKTYLWHSLKEGCAAIPALDFHFCPPLHQIVALCLVWMLVSLCCSEANRAAGWEPLSPALSGFSSFTSVSMLCCSSALSLQRVCLGRRCVKGY